MAELSHSSSGKSPTDVQPTHENAKNSASEFIRTAAATAKTIEEQISRNPPRLTYTHLTYSQPGQFHVNTQRSEAIAQCKVQDKQP